MVLKRNLPEIWTFPCVFPQKLVFVPTQKPQKLRFLSPVCCGISAPLTWTEAAPAASWVGLGAAPGLSHGDLGIPHRVPLNPRVHEEMFMKWL